MFKRLFGCFRPPFPSPGVHPKPPTPVPTPLPSPTPTPPVELEPLPAKTRTIDTVTTLQDRGIKLHERCESLEAQVAQLQKKAKAYRLEGKPNHALLCLKKSKMLENSVKAVSNMITKVDGQQVALEEADTLKETMAALSEAVNVTKGVMDGHKIDQVDELMDDIQENEYNMQEVNERLAESTGVLAGVDDDDLLAELDAELENDGMSGEVEEADVLNNRRPELPVLPEAETVNAILPPAPTHPIRIETKTTNKSMTRQNLNLESA